MSLLLLLPLVQVAVAADDAAQVELHLAQAHLFIKRGWYADAGSELERARRLPAGAESYEVHSLSAQVAWELMDIGLAQEMATAAARLAPDPERARQAEDLAQSYATRFGFVVVEAPYEGMTSRLQLELTSVIFDPELKQYIKRQAAALQARTPLPLRLGLPAGDYVINGEQVTVPAGGETTLELGLPQLGARGLAALQVTRAEVSAGISIAPGAPQLLPSPSFQVGISQPLGPVLMGLSVDATSWSYLIEGERLEIDTGFGLGLRVGREFRGRAPIAVRPSLLARAMQQPGVPMDCVLAGAWTCGAQGSLAAPELRVYSTGLAWALGGELSLDYREAGRTTALGTGVRIAMDRAFGSMPGSGTADLTSQPGTVISWTAAAAPWQVTHLRVLANLSFAF